MNEQTLQALRELADKLGTTTEYLWAALLRQAPIAGATDLAMMALLLIASIVLLRLAVVQTRINRKATCYADKSEGKEDVLWIAGTALFVVTLMVLAACLSDALAGLFNPEFWALKQILP